MCFTMFKLLAVDSGQPKFYNSWKYLQWGMNTTLVSAGNSWYAMEIGIFQLDNICHVDSGCKTYLLYQQLSSPPTIAHVTANIKYNIVNSEQSIGQNYVHYTHFAAIN